MPNSEQQPKMSSHARRMQEEVERKQAREKAAKQANAGKWTRRGFIGLAGATVIGAGSYVAYGELKNKDKGMTDLEQLSATEFDKISKEVITAYNNVFGVNTDPKDSSKFTFIPPASQITEAKFNEYCKAMPCLEAAGYANQNELYINGVLLDRRFDRQGRNDPKSRREAFYATLSHELTHFIAKSFPMDEKLFQALSQVAPVWYPDILSGKTLGPDTVVGQKLGLKVGDDQGAGFFTSLYEVEAELASEKYMKDVEGKDIYYGKALDERYLTEKRMYSGLLQKLDGGFEHNLPLAVRSTTIPGGRTEFIQMVGKQFSNGQSNGLVTGLDIMFAISAKNTQRFNELTLK